MCLTFFFVLPVAAFGQAQPDLPPIGLDRDTLITTWAENDSYATTCAEEDNVNIPVYTDDSDTDYFEIIATHPTYNVTDYTCPFDFSGCLRRRTPADSCSNLWDDGTNVVKGCTVPNWWRPYSMTITVGGTSGSYHYLVLHRKIQGFNSWPEFLVLYEDSYLRLKPHAPIGAPDVCYGTSVVLGPADDVGMSRPYADVQQVTVDPANLALDVNFLDGGSAHVDLSVNRERAVANVTIDYPINSTSPFAIFRSMYVAEGNADAAHIQSPAGTEPVLGTWSTLSGPWWFLHRTTPSSHNQSAPDMTMLTGRPTLTITSSANNIQLDWQDATRTPRAYQVHRSIILYFEANQGTKQDTTPAGTTSWIDSNAIHDGVNYFYRVLRETEVGLPKVPTNDVALFHFAIVAGN